MIFQYLEFKYIISYYLTLFKQMEEMDGIKVVVLGDSGVGKTAIINRKIFQKFSSQMETTVGASYNSIKITYPEYNKLILKMDIWDTAGSEQFRAINKLFYNGAVCAVLVYDITEVQSFNSLKNYWLGEIKQNGAKDISKHIIKKYIF